MLNNNNLHLFYISKKHKIETHAFFRTLCCLAKGILCVGSISCLVGTIVEIESPRHHFMHLLIHKPPELFIHEAYFRDFLRLRTFHQISRAHNHLSLSFEISSYDLQICQTSVPFFLLLLIVYKACSLPQVECITAFFMVNDNLVTNYGIRLLERNSRNEELLRWQETAVTK